MDTTRRTGHKNNFARAAKHRLLDLNLSVNALARELGRPRSTVSTAINGRRFPRVRAAVAKKLNLTLTHD
jgi:plasmid maintenance system antidote protein VapI